MKRRLNVIALLCLFLVIIIIAGDFIFRSLAPQSLKLPKYENFSSVATIKDELSASTSITCILITNPRSHTRLARYQQITWMSSCSKTVTVTSHYDPQLDDIILSQYTGYEELYGKVLDGFHSVDPSTNWYIKVDDDTVVIMSNLKRYLLKMNSSEPLLLGLPLVFVHTDNLTTEFAAGGPGYIFSKEALMRFKKLARSKPECSYPGKTKYEDVNIGACLFSLGVQLSDTRDHLGRHRFLPYAPWIMINDESETEEKHMWLQKISKYPFHFGVKYLCDEPISFHEIRDPNDIYLLYYLLYYIKR